MEQLLNSTLTKNILSTGKLPELPISFENESIYKLSAALLIAAIIAILFAYFIFKYSKYELFYRHIFCFTNYFYF